MDLIDRYVNRVKFFLSGAQRDDIVRELAADLRAEVQDKEAEAGRPLEEQDLRAILTRRGHPLLVAGRYMPERYLIGPALFPVYRLVLKMATVFYLVPWLVVWLGFVILSPTYRAAHGGLAFMGPLSTWLKLALGVIGTVTLVFALLERAQNRAAILDRWDPARLPAVRDRNVIPRFGSIAEAVGGIVFLLWWTGNLHFPSLTSRTGDVVVTASAWFNSFYWPVLCQATANVVLAGVNLFRPWWTVARALVRLAANLASAAIAALMLQAGPWVEISAPGLSASAREALLKGANLGVYWLLIGILLVAILIACFEDGRRVYRLCTEKKPIPV